MGRVFELWAPEFDHPEVENIPLLDDVRHKIVHKGMKDFSFLHGVAVVYHRGTLYCAWANSPIDENSTDEVLRSRKSNDDGRSWSEPELIGPGYSDERNHSHCSFFSHDGSLWAYAASFSKLNSKGKVFPRLRTEAFKLDESTGRWQNNGIAVENFWPYEEPKRMANGAWIMGGQDSDANCIVAISDGEDFSKWKEIPLPSPEGIPLRFGETTTYAERDEIVAVIRYRSSLAPSIPQQVAVVSISNNYGDSWSEAIASNLPAGDSKLYAGLLSDGRRYLVYNADTEARRSTLVVATGKPGERVLSRVWRIQHGYPPEPRRDGFAKGKQWSYPYAYEHDGDLIIGYSVSKEDACLSWVPIEALHGS